MGAEAPFQVDARVHIGFEPDVLTARQRGRAAADRLGFSPTDQALIATAISEVARNILQYAGSGDVTIGIVGDGMRRGVLVIAEDRGPGIPDLEAAMRDGFSTGGGLGLGLPGAKRLMDEFSILSAPGKGTVVRMIKWTHASW